MRSKCSIAKRAARVRPRGDSPFVGHYDLVLATSRTGPQPAGPGARSTSAIPASPRPEPRGVRPRRRARTVRNLCPQITRRFPARSRPGRAAAKRKAPDFSGACDETVADVDYAAPFSNPCTATNSADANSAHWPQAPADCPADRGAPSFGRRHRTHDRGIEVDPAPIARIRGGARSSRFPGFRGPGPTAAS